MGLGVDLWRHEVGRGERRKMSGLALGSQRRTKLTSAEAALLAGELKKPSWESRNEGIHERVSFEDSIWGFDLAGGSFYKTPLRVTAVKKDSRAEKAGIRPGDKLIRINDIDTSTLTIQEAHEIIIESGIHIRLAVSAPDDFEDSYSCYQDPIEIEQELERQRKLEEENARRKRRMQCKINQNWSLQWPWVSKRRIIYKESNCFLVPSKYEDRHRDKFPLEKPELKNPEDVKLFSKNCETPTPTTEKKEPVFENGNTEKANESEPNTLENGLNENSLDVNEMKQDPEKNIKEEQVENNIIEEHNTEEVKEQTETSNKEEQEMDVQETETLNDIDDENDEESKEEILNEDLELENWNPNDVKEDEEADEEETDDLESDKNEEEPIEQEQDDVLEEILNTEEASEENDETDI